MTHDVKNNRLLKGTVDIFKRGASNKTCQHCEHTQVSNIFSKQSLLAIQCQ